MWWTRKKEVTDYVKIGEWCQEGQDAYLSGKGPTKNPYDRGTSARIWWLCGWEIQWSLDNLDKESANETEETTEET